MIGESGNLHFRGIRVGITFESFQSGDGLLSGGCFKEEVKMSVTHPARRPNPWWVATVSGMASYIDAAAIISFGIVVTIYASVLGFGPTEIGLVSGGLTFGIAIGAFAGGRLGDRFGRRPVFTVTMVVIIVGVLVMILANNFAFALTGAVLVGLGTGADLPVSLSTISEAGNDRNRGRLISLSNILWLVGVVAAMVLGISVGNLGHLGGQLLLAHIGVMALIVLVCRLTIPESELWLKARAERKAGVETVRADRSAVRELFSRTYATPFFGLIFFYALVNLAGNTAGQFGTYLLVNVAKVDVSTASGLGLITLPVALVGYAVFMKIADKPYRFTWFTIGAGLMILGQAVIAVFGFSVTTMIVGGMIGIIGASFAGETILKVWAQESFPTLLRTTAQGIIIAVARFSAAVLASVTPLILQAGVSTLYWFLTAVTAAGVITAWVVFRKRDRHNEFDVEDELESDLDPSIHAISTN
ncbi:MFS transporter [Arthrobacter sp. NPDC056691]|uniref:MFS transporter n=1 Tax=Arthrobacter sp. NPDC056691 TaxID=3345913 RepID=UPI00366DB5D3